MQTRAKDGIFRPNSISTLTTLEKEKAPTCFSKANKILKWCQAMAEEINDMLVNKNWDLVLYDASKNLVGTKWIYTKKN